MPATYTATCNKCGEDFVLEITHLINEQGVGQRFVSALKTCVHIATEMKITVSYQSLNDADMTVVVGGIK